MIKECNIPLELPITSKSSILLYDGPISTAQQFDGSGFIEMTNKNTYQGDLVVTISKRVLFFFSH